MRVLDLSASVPDEQQDHSCGTSDSTSTLGRRLFFEEPLSQGNEHTLVRRRPIHELKTAYTQMILYESFDGSVPELAVRAPCWDTNDVGDKDM